MTDISNVVVIRFEKDGQTFETAVQNATRVTLVDNRETDIDFETERILPKKVAAHLHCAKTEGDLTKHVWCLEDGADLPAVPKTETLGWK